MKKTPTILLFFVALTIGFAQSKITFESKISNLNASAVFIKDFANNTLQEIKANDKGIFKASFDLKDGIYLFFDGTHYARLYFKKDANLVLIADAKNFDQTLNFEGSNAKENVFLTKNMIAEKSYDYKSLLDSNPDVFEKQLAEKQKADALAFEQATLDKDFTDLLKKNYELLYATLKQFHGQNQIASNSKNIIPSFEYLNIKGGKTKLEDLRGKLVYIDVWATWCGPCRAELPFLKKLEDKFKDKNIAFVSISIDDKKDIEKWKKFVTAKQLEGIQLFENEGSNSKFIQDFQITSIPRFILIDVSGKVIAADALRPSSPELEAQLEQLLGEK
jgi:thiol-disulfide isomerase/thioredoxin